MFVYPAEDQLHNKQFVLQAVPWNFKSANFLLQKLLVGKREWQRCIYKQ